MATGVRPASVAEKRRVHACRTIALNGCLQTVRGKVTGVQTGKDADRNFVAKGAIIPGLRT